MTPLLCSFCQKCDEKAMPGLLSRGFSPKKKSENSDASHDDGSQPKQDFGKTLVVKLAVELFDLDLELVNVGGFGSQIEERHRMAQISLQLPDPEVCPFEAGLHLFQLILELLKGGLLELLLPTNQITEISLNLQKESRIPCPGLWNRRVPCWLRNGRRSWL